MVIFFVLGIAASIGWLHVVNYIAMQFPPDESRILVWIVAFVLTASLFMGGENTDDPTKKSGR